MNVNYISPSDWQKKWQRMITIVSQHTEHTNSLLDFKKLVIYRLLAENIIIFLLQYMGLMFSTLISHSAPLWLATGTACGFIFLRGYSILPGIWLGTFFAFWWTPLSFIAISGIATVYAAQVFLIRWLTCRFSSPTLIFYQVRPFSKFVLCSTLVTATASLLIEAFSNLSFENFFQACVLWLEWWLANLNAVMIVACAIVTWDIYFPQIRELKYVNKSLWLLYALLLSFVIVLLYQPHLTSIMQAGILLFGLLISYYFGWCGSIFAVFTCGFILSLGAYLDAPFFTQNFSFNRIVLVQLILFAASMMGGMLTFINKKILTSLD